MSKKNKKLGWDKRMAFAMLNILKENDGIMSRSSLIKAVEEREGGLIPAEMREMAPSGGRLRWAARVEFGCQRFVKAGFLRMNRGTWTLTKEGADAVDEGESVAVKTADKVYAGFRQAKEDFKQFDMGISDKIDVGDSDDLEEDEISKEGVFSDPASDARGEIEEHIKSLDWMKFQDLCAALLRGMGYHVRHVAPPGPDGGVDVIAYKDPLGCERPRIKLQAKHQKAAKVQTDVVTKIVGKLTDGDVGIIVSSSGFASGSREAARDNRNHHIELIDMNRLVDLWQEHYDNLSEEDKALLPLQKVYFLNKKGIKKES